MTDRWRRGGALFLALITVLSMASGFTAVGASPPTDDFRSTDTGPDHEVIDGWSSGTGDDGNGTAGDGSNGESTDGSTSNESDIDDDGGSAGNESVRAGTANGSETTTGDDSYSDGGSAENSTTIGESTSTDDATTESLSRSDVSNASADLILERDEVYVGETVAIGFPERHPGESYEWEVVAGPDTSDEQLLHTSTAEIESDPDVVLAHKGRVTSFRPTETGSYQIEVTVDGTTRYNGTIEVKQEEVIDGKSRHELLMEYAPVLNFHSEENFYPTRYEALVENSELKVAGSDPSPVSSEPSLLDLGRPPYAENTSLYLDPVGDESEYANYQNRYPETVYGAVHTNVTLPYYLFPPEKSSIHPPEKEYTALAYWMFYIHDPKPGVSGPARLLRHTGDQEPVIVLLDENGPQWIVAQQHFGGEIRPWETVVNGKERPQIYPALGAHSNFLFSSSPDERFLPQNQYFTVPKANQLSKPVRSEIPYVSVEDHINPTDIDRIALNFYYDRTGTNRTLRPEPVDSDSYELTVLTDEVSWANFTGDIYTYPALEDDFTGTRLYGPRGKIPMEKETKWGAEGVSAWVEDSVEPGFAQRHGTIKHVSVVNRDNRTVDVKLHNNGPQPHEFVLNVSATPTGQSTERYLDEEPRVYMDSIRTETETPKNPITGTLGGATTEVVRISGNATKTVSLPVDSTAQTWDVEVELWEYAAEDRGHYHFEDSYTVRGVDITPQPAEARIEFLDQDSGFYLPGEQINSTVEVSNTGTEEQTYFVGYSAVGPNGEYYDNNGTTGKPVTIPSGEARTVSLSWTVEERIRSGTYNFVSAVWNESERDNLTTRLDDEFNSKRVLVAPRPVVEDIEVESVGQDSIVVNATATNEGATAEWQSLALSFPEMENASGIEVRETNFEGIDNQSEIVLEPGDTAGSEYGRNTTQLEYPLLEPSATNWSTGEVKYIEFELPAEQNGSIAYAKSVASADDQRMWTYEPGINRTNHVDQQQEFVYAFSLVEEEERVDEEVNISVLDVDGRAGGANSPDPVQVDVRITANEDPYPVDVSGQMFDIEVGNESLGTTVVVDDNGPPGEYTLYFVPPAQPDAGEYDLEIEFVDRRFETELTDNASRIDAISYSEGEATQVAASLQIDRSGSMGSIIGEAKTSAKAFVGQAGDDDYVSIVSYSSYSTTNHPLARLSDSRAAIIDEIEALRAGGSTNTGDAMIDGLETLEDAPNGTERAGIHMTDGNSNAGPSESRILNEIVPAYNDRGICLYTIGFTDGADEEFMKDVANASDCGFYRFAAESGEAGDAEATLQEVFQDMQQDVTGDSILHQEAGTVIDTVQHRFRIDRSVTRTTLNVEFTGYDLRSGSQQQSLTASDGGSLLAKSSIDNSSLVTLYGPDGNEVRPEEEPNVERSIVGDTLIFRIDGPSAGEWSYEITNPAGQDGVEYETELFGAARSTLEVGTAGKTYYQGGKTTLTATLIGPSGGVSNATVRADVVRPNGTTATVRLREESSGLYAGATELTDNGSYTATVTASAGNISRTRAISWNVENSSPLSIGSLAATEITQGERATIDIELRRENGPAEAESVLIGASDLTATNGTSTVSSAAVTIDRQSVDIEAGENWTTTAVIEIPEGTPPGEYEGTVEAFRDDGSVVTEPIEITVIRAATFQLTIDEPTITVEEAEEMEVTPDVTNVGGESATKLVELLDFNGTVVDSVEVTRTPGQTGEVKLGWTINETGRGEISVRTEDDTVNVTVEVVEGGDSGESAGGGQLGGGSDGEVEITGGTLLNQTVATHGTVRVEVGLANYDPVEGSITLTLSAAGTGVDERTVSVGASNERLVTLEHAFPEAGTYDLAVNGVAVGTVRVERRTDTPTTTTAYGGTTPVGTATMSPSETSEGPTETATRTVTEQVSSPTVGTTTTGDGSGPSVLVVLLALGLFAFGIRRRRLG